MLAFTMQFSNNQPSPTTPQHPLRLHEAGFIRGEQPSFPQDPTACPTRSTRPRSTPKQY